MLIKDLIKNNDYDYISWRVTAPKILDDDSIFFGICKSENGKLISLDGDYYDLNAEIISHKEWSNDNHKNGLTVIEKVEWSGEDEKN